MKEKYNIVGLMALYKFKLATEMLDDLAKYCDYICVRWDSSGDHKLYEYAVEHPLVIKTMLSCEKWNRWNWREDLLGMASSLKPDLILFPDEDERFGDGLKDDIEIFMEMQDKKSMYFDYEMYPPEVPLFPKDKHVKAYKWMPQLTYHNYKYYARVTSYTNLQSSGYNAKTKIIHYSQCCGEKEQHR